MSSLNDSVRAEICSYARKDFRSPEIVALSINVDLTACTPPDIIRPGDILRNFLWGTEGVKW